MGSEELLKSIDADLPVVDWTTRNLYFQNYLTGFINVIDPSNSTNIKTLYETTVNNHRSLIALDPTRGMGS